MIHRRRYRPAFAISALLALLGAILFTAPAHAEPEAGITLSFGKVSPIVFDGEDELTFTGTLTNRSSEPLHTVTIWWRVKTAVLNLETSADWFAHEEDSPPVTFARYDLEEEIAPGQSINYRMVVPSESLPFDAASVPGVRGMELIVTATNDDGVAHRDAVRSTIVWFPDASMPPTSLSVAVPLTPKADEWEKAYEQQLSLAAVTNERLITLIDQFEHIPLTWGLDAAVLDSVPLNGLARIFSDPAPDAEPDPFEWSEPESIAEFTAAIRAQHESWGAAAKLPQVVSLGWGSPDYGALSLAGESGSALASANVRYAAETIRGQGLSVNDTITWSRAGLSTSTGLDTSTGTGSSDSTTGPEPAAVFPAGTQTALVPPVVGGAYQPASAGQPAHYAPDAEFIKLVLSEASPEELAAQSLLYAQSASMLALTLPADLSLAEAERAANNLRFLKELPWLKFTSLKYLNDPLTQELTPMEQAVPAREVIDTAATALQGADAFTEITENPEKFAALAYSTIFAPLAYPATLSTPARTALTELAETHLAASPLTIQKPSTVNLISQGGTLPIRVENSSEITLAPIVVLETGDARLRADEPVQGDLAPRQSTTVQLPITAVANGNVEATIRLLNRTGEDLAEPQTFTVRVRADWESTGTAIIAGIVAVSFVIGLIRNIRKAPTRDSRG